MTIHITTGVLALRPWNCFDLDATGGAIHPAHGVGERDGDVPDRDEFELPGLGHAVISGACFSATGASGFGVGSRDNLGDDPPAVSVTSHDDRMVNETLEAMDFVE